VNMKFTVRTSGGIGNIRIQGEIDTEELDPTLAEQVKSVLTPEHLITVPRDTAGSTVDVTQYEVGIFQEDGVHSYTVDEAIAPQEIVEVLQALVHEIILKKRQT
jgi:hypothetical protein